MSQVFVLGSGFSRAISSEMPTLTALSDAVKENLKASDKPEIPQASSPLANNFEQWLSYLIEAPPWLSEGDQLRNRGAFADVSRAVHDVLVDRELAVRAHEDCPEWLGKLVRYWQRNECRVITFNYDLLVEFAWFEHVDYPSKSVMHLYPVPLSYLNSRTGAALGAASGTGWNASPEAARVVELALFRAGKPAGRHNLCGRDAQLGLENRRRGCRRGRR